MKKALVTGSSGFLGSILITSLPYDIITLSRRSADIIADLRKTVPSVPQCDVIIHAAGKARGTPNQAAKKSDFFAVNVQGTKNLLLGIERSKAIPKEFVFISSVAVYGKHKGLLITEEEKLMPATAYGKSKMEAENLVIEWCKAYNVTCTVLRLPLLAGPNPPGNLKAMIKGISQGYYFTIHGGTARKSMVLAEDVAGVIPTVAAVGGIYNLTDRYHPSFKELASHIADEINCVRPRNIPLWIVRLIAWAGNVIGERAPINSKKLDKILSDLTFNDDKAVKAFGWNPKPVLSNFRIR